MKKKKELGFTMVELLAVIVIISILSTIGIASVARIRKSQSDKFDKTQRDIITQAAKTYFTDNRTNLPVSLCTTETITLDELQKAQYIGEVLDYKKRPYKADSYVSVTKSSDGYNYTPYIYDADGDVIPIDDSYSAIEIVYSIKHPNETGVLTDLLKHEVDNKITYYSNKDYVVLKLNMKPTDNGVCSYKYTITGKNADGKRINYTSENISLSEHYNEETGVSEEIKLNYSAYKDGNYKLTAMVRDGKGYETRKTFNIVLDQTPPSCKIKLNGTLGLKQGDSQWYLSKTTVSLESDDTTAGIEVRDEGANKTKGRGLTKSITPSYDGTLTGEQTDTNKDGVNWYGYAKDYAGNKISCVKNVKVDTVKPVIENITKKLNEDRSVTKGENEWSNKDLILDVKGKDKHSEIGTWYYTYDKNIAADKNSITKLAKTEYKNGVNGAVITYNNPTGKLITSPFTAERKEAVYIHLCDNAGNCVKKSTNIYIDKTLPTCTVSFSGTKGENSWYVSNASVGLSTKDPGKITSGVEKYGLTTGGESYNNKTSGTQTDTKSTTWNGYVKDIAGNINKCSNAVKVDTKPPTIDNISVSTAQSGFNSSLVNVSVSVSDTNPTKYGLSNTGYLSSKYNSLPYSSSPVYSWNLNAAYDGGKKTVYVTAKDEAGNIAKSSNSNYSIYKQCTSSYISSSSDGACDQVCDGGTYIHTDYYTDSYIGVSCGSNNTAMACVNPGCCDQVVYEDGPECSAECGPGTYEVEAYSAYDTNIRCPQFDASSGGSACTEGECCATAKWGSWSEYKTKKNSKGVITKCYKQRTKKVNGKVCQKQTKSYGLGNCIGKSKCNIRGNTIYNTLTVFPYSAYNVGYSCTCRKWETKGYWRYCTDSSGNLWTNLRANSYNAHKAQWVCPSVPAGKGPNGENFHVIDDSGGKWKNYSQACYGTGKC